MNQKDTIFLIVIIALSAQIGILHYSDYSTRIFHVNTLEILLKGTEIDQKQLELITRNTNLIKHLMEKQEIETITQIGPSDITKFISSCLERDGAYNLVSELCQLQNGYTIYFLDWDIESDKEVFDWLENPK